MLNYKVVGTLAFFLFFASSMIAEAQFRKGIDEPMTVYQRKNRHGALYFTAGYGVSSYYGDLKGSRLQLWAKPSAQLGVQYRVNDRLHFRSELAWYRISGADSLNDRNSGIWDRNLSFRSDNFELSLVSLVHLFNKYETKSPVIPYFFGGIGLTTNNPKAYYKGEWHRLRPLRTEGVAYGPVALVFPLGAGLLLDVSNNWDISLEGGYRITFVDYLDDVSTTYKGVENFEENSIAAALSDRRTEIGLDARPAGSRRGNSTGFDGYLIVGLKVVFTPTFIPEEVRRIQR